MASPSTFFFAGIGTVVLAIAGGFGGGLLVANNSGSSNSAKPASETALVQAMQAYDKPKAIKAPEQEPVAETRDDVTTSGTTATNSSETTGAAERESDPQPSEAESQPSEEVAADTVPLPQPRPMMASVEPERNVDTKREQAGDTKREQASALPMQRAKERNSQGSTNAQNSERQGKMLETQMKAAKGEAEFVDDNGVRHVVRTRSGRQPTRAEIKKVQDALRSMRRDREDFRMSYESGERRGMFGLFRD